MKEAKTNQLPSVKTIIKANNKRHLKLKYDSEENKKPSKSRTISSKKTLSRSSECSSKPKFKKAPIISGKKQSVISK